MAHQQLKIAFFGATGGCCRAALMEVLRAGHLARALLRTPSKLTPLEEGCPAENLTIVQGDIRDVQKVKEVIDGCDVIMSGIGCYVKFVKFRPVLLDPNLCKDALDTITSAMTQVERPPKRLIVVSTTGLDKRRDIPIAMVPLYRWLLHEPHEDKRKMEEAVINAGKAGIVDEWIIVRAALLTNGPKTEKYHAGKGIRGYTVSRNDVGHFLSQNLVSKEWVGEFPVLIS